MIVRQIYIYISPTGYDVIYYHIGNQRYIERTRQRHYDNYSELPKSLTNILAYILPTFSNIENYVETRTLSLSGDRLVVYTERLKQ